MTDQDVLRKIEAIEAECGGSVSVSVRGISHDLEINYNEDRVTSSASLIKVPILVAALKQAAEGKLSLETEYELPPERTRGAGVLRYMHPGMRLNLQDLLTLMIIVSDNTATNAVIDLLEMDLINAVMRSMGYTHTRLQRKMYDWPAIDIGLDNFCNAFEIADLLLRIAKKEAAGEQWDRLALNILQHQQDKDKLGMLLPDDVRIANKAGARQGILHDCGIISFGDLSYAICILSQGIALRGDAILAIAGISRLLYEFLTENTVI